MYTVISYAVIWIIAFTVGVVLGKSYKKKTIGTLRIDSSEPNEAPLLFLELSTDPRNIMHEKQVLVDVSTESYLSQK
jgi:hypothetical protein